MKLIKRMSALILAFIMTFTACFIANADETEISSEPATESVSVPAEESEENPYG